jgi:hypothetical protein
LTCAACFRNKRGTSRCRCKTEHDGYERDLFDKGTEQARTDLITQEIRLTEQLKATTVAAP